MQPSKSVSSEQGMTTARPELGISPVLFQAIAQLTASSSTSSNQAGASENPTPDSKAIATSLIKQAHANSREMEGTQSAANKDTTRVVSQLLQKLNEPVKTLIPQSRSASQLLMSATNMNQPARSSDSITNQPSSATLTQAGLSMLGLTSENSSNQSTIPFSNVMSRTNNNTLGDELNNFLLKQEPVEEDIASSSPANRPLPSGRAINTDVSSVLSALASQHAQHQQLQQSLNQKSVDAAPQPQQNVTSVQLQNTTFHIIHPNQTASLNSTAALLPQQTLTDSPSASNPNSADIVNMTPSSISSKPQQQQPQQIIIYGMPYDNSNIISAPGSVSSSSLSTARIINNDGNNTNVIIEQNPADITALSSAGTNVQQTPFRLVQPSNTGNSSNNNNINNNTVSNPNTTMDQKPLVISSDQNYTSVQENVAGPSGESGDEEFKFKPVTDVHNSVEGMNMPCPVCGDKVSGYHYGIFSCESCKGFFKRTVQNKKTFNCLKQSECVINSINRKKCPACRYKRCLMMGMKLEAIRQDRTRGGRSSYEGCTPQKARPQAMVKKQKRVSRLVGDPLLVQAGSSSSQEMDDGSKSHRNLVAILNHNAHKQTTPSPGAPVIPELLRDIMNLEPLLSDDDITPESIMEATTFPDQALYSYMMQLAELRLYKLVRWARNLPQFGAISTDDQILLLQNCWSELIGLALCWRSIDTPNQISISSTHHITTEWAQHIGCEDLVARLLSISNSFRNLYMDEYEFVALKVLLLISPDVKGLKEPRKIRDCQDKLLESLMVYTASHYSDMKNKFGELLLRLPELSRLSFLSKNILLKYLPTSSTSCGLLVELLKGDSRLDPQQDGATGSGAGDGGVDGGLGLSAL